MNIDLIPIEHDLLGESPVWDERVQALYWADQFGRRLRRYNPSSGEVAEWALPQELGCIVMTEDPRIMMVALPERYVMLSLDSGEAETFLTVPQPRAGVRLNDGRCDRSGRLIAGSVTTDGGDAGGRIWRISPDGQIEEIRAGLVIANAICCSPAGDRFYYTDSRTGIIYARDVQDRDAAIGAEMEFADTRPHGRAPDGATVDAEGGVWVAMVMSGAILRFNPDGTFDRKIELPVPNVSSLTFGGADLDVLFVTSVRETGMLISSDHPNAGALLAISNLGVRGVCEGRFGWPNPSGAATLKNSGE